MVRAGRRTRRPPSGPDDCAGWPSDAAPGLRNHSQLWHSGSWLAPGGAGREADAGSVPRSEHLLAVRRARGMRLCAEGVPLREQHEALSRTPATPRWSSAKRPPSRTVDLGHPWPSKRSTRRGRRSVPRWRRGWLVRYRPGQRARPGPRARPGQRAACSGSRVGAPAQDRRARRLPRRARLRARPYQRRRASRGQGLGTPGADAVDDPVAPTSSGAQAGQMAAERPAKPVRIIGQRAEDEVEAGASDLLREAEQITLGASRDANLVRVAHRGAKRAHRASLSATRPAVRSASPSAMASGAPGVVKMSTVSSSAARSSGEMSTAAGRPGPGAYGGVPGSGVGRAPLANDRRTARHCTAAGDRYLVVPTSSEAAFRRALRDLGYRLASSDEP